MAIEWTQPIQHWNGEQATPVYVPTPDEVVFLEFKGDPGRWAYNFDGTPLPINAFLGRVENVPNQV
jgi:hypothetical protein